MNPSPSHFAELNYLAMLVRRRKTLEEIAERMGHTVDWVRATLREHDDIMFPPTVPDPEAPALSLDAAPSAGVNHVQRAMLHALSYYNGLGETLRAFGRMMEKGLSPRDLSARLVDEDVRSKSPAELAEYLCNEYIILPVPKAPSTLTTDAPDKDEYKAENETV